MRVYARAGTRQTWAGETGEGDERGTDCGVHTVVPGCKRRGEGGEEGEEGVSAVGTDARREKQQQSKEQRMDGRLAAPSSPRYD